MTFVLAALLAANTLTKPPVFSSTVEQIDLQVSVQDPGGKYVTDLNLNDFKVIENGVPQTISHFDYHPLPIDLTLLLDTSDSMRPRLSNIYKMAAQFVQAAQPDTVQVIQFSTFALPVIPRTDDMLEVQGGLSKLSQFNELGQRLRDNPNMMKSKRIEDIAFRESLFEWLDLRAMSGSTALYNSLYVTSKYVKKLSTEDSGTRRQVIILISDGDDTASALTADNVMKTVREMEAPIYAICIRRNPDTEPEKSQKNDDFLIPLTRDTGGQYKVLLESINGPSLPSQLLSWCQHVADELRAQYHIGYASSSDDRNGQLRTIQVSIGRANYVLRHKTGYYAACDAGRPCAQTKGKTP